MRKFKKIAATVRATAIPGESLAQVPTRRRLLAGLSAVVLASLARPAGRARADQPTGGGILAENFTWLTAPNPAPVTPITRADGQETTLAAFQGRVVLLNFWATWCAPCIREMPSLDRLQAALGDRGLSVVAVSIDRAGVKVTRPFAKRLGLARLGLYYDPEGALFRGFTVTGLPANFLIDRGGGIVGAYGGPAEWDGPEARALIEFYLNRPEHAANSPTHPIAAGG